MKGNNGLRTLPTDGIITLYSCIQTTFLIQLLYLSCHLVSITSPSTEQYIQSAVSAACFEVPCSPPIVINERESDTTPPIKSFPQFLENCQPTTEPWIVEAIPASKRIVFLASDRFSELVLNTSVPRHTDQLATLSSDII